MNKSYTFNTLLGSFTSLLINVLMRSKLYASTLINCHIYLLIANLTSSLSKQEDLSNWDTNQISFFKLCSVSQFGVH